MKYVSGLCVLAVASLVSAADTIVDYRIPDRGIVAFRGSSNSIPANSVSAIRDALLRGSQMIHIDVHSSSDGQLVVVTSTVQRTSDGDSKVADMTLADLKKLKIGRGRYANDKVPTLQEVFKLLPENVLMSLRTHGGAETAKAIVKAVVDADRLHQCIITGNRKDIATARQANGDIKVCLIADGNNAAVDAAIEDKTDFIIWTANVSQNARLLKKLNDAEVSVIHTPLTDEAAIKAAIEAGVHFVASTNPSTALATTDTYGIERLNPVYRKVATSNPVKPMFKDGEAQELPEFKDNKDWIHHDLWVETEFDTDGDGRPDRMHVSVARQKQTDSEGLKVPVVYNSSPYFSGTASGKTFFWTPEQELGEEPPEHAAPPSVKFQSRRLIISARHQKDWVPRGFAVVHSASSGTGLSQGCPTIGGDNESLGPKAVVDWLCGRAKGYTTPNGNREVEAYWCTGKVGMTGTSYNGTIPLACATTGVEGLEAIIPVAPNTSYYHYYRSNGLVRHPGGYVGEDIDVLYNFVNSGDPDKREYCNCEVRDKEMAEGFDRDTGDYNDFWAGRDYLNDMKGMKAALLMAHAFNDWNVMPNHSVRIYQRAKEMGLPTQCYFHQGGHGGPPPIKQMNRWFTRYLYGIENRVEDDPKAWVVRERVDRLKPTAYGDYPNPAAAPVALRPGKGGKAAGSLTEAPEGDQGKETLTDDAGLFGSELAFKKESDNRLMYVTPTLTKPLHISGYTKIRTKISCDKPAANFSIWLVSLPWKNSGDVKIYDNVITRGWADPQNHSSLTKGEPLEPGREYELTFNLQPDDHVVPAGQQIGLMIFSSDREHTLWPKPGTKVTVNLDETVLELPIVGGTEAFAAATAAKAGE